MAAPRKHQATRGKDRRRAAALHRLKIAGRVTLGLAGAAALVYVIYPHLPRHHTAPGAAHAAVQPPAAAPAPPPAAGPAAASEAPQPRFDFYTMLPKLKVIVPRTEDASTAPPAADTPGPAAGQAGGAGVYALQVGSFRDLTDADRVKAQLALIGVEADIYSVKANNDTWHRLMVGPFGNLHQLNRVAQRLQKNKVDYLVMKVKG